MKHNIFIIVAADRNLGIGKNGVMPWDFKKELKHFQDVTTKIDDPHKMNMVIMGRTTWYSIPSAHRPLKKRKNVVLTREGEKNSEGAWFCSSIEEAISLADDCIENIFIVGGASVYKQAIDQDIADGIYLTQIDAEYDCDTHFPDIPSEFGEAKVIGGDEEDGVRFKYLLFSK